MKKQDNGFSIESMADLWQEIRAVEHYLRYLRDKYTLINQHVTELRLKNNGNTPNEYNNFRFWLKVTRTGRFKLEHPELVNRTIDYVEKYNAQAVMPRKIHPMTLARIVGEGIFEIEGAKGEELRSNIKVETSKKLEVSYISEAEGAEAEEILLKKKNLL